MYAFNDSSIVPVLPQAPITVDHSYRTNLITAPEYRSYLFTHTTIQTLIYGTQEAEVVAVVPSPFGDSEMMAYVANLPDNPHTFTDYVPLSDVPRCPECGFPLSECDCPPSRLDDPEFDDYRQDQPKRPLQTYTIGNRIFTTPLMIEASYRIPAAKIEQAVKTSRLEGVRIGSKLFVELDAFEAYRVQQGVQND